ncbi:MAG: hypothetical protein HY553_16220 [Elusimicrobia bacterium]|nr:hypothetical protein [Elusimicrobiota bacterium]
MGRRGGAKSRRALSAAQARDMVRIREARKAYRRFRVSCFWSFDPARKIQAADIPWIVETLQRHGGRAAWEAAERLCR